MPRSSVGQFSSGTAPDSEVQVKSTSWRAWRGRAPDDYFQPVETPGFWTRLTAARPSCLRQRDGRRRRSCHTTVAIASSRPNAHFELTCLPDFSSRDRQLSPDTRMPVRHATPPRLPVRAAQVCFGPGLPSSLLGTRGMTGFRLAFGPLWPSSASWSSDLAAAGCSWLSSLRSPSCLFHHNWRSM